MTDITPHDLSPLISSPIVPSLHLERSSRFSFQRGWLWVLGGAVLGTTVLGISIWQFTGSTSPTQVSASTSAEVPAIAVQTKELQTQSIPTTLELSGTITPIDQATLSTRVTGRITELSLESGDRFQKGDPLVRIDVVDMAAQTSQAHAAVAVAESVVAQRNADLSAAQALLNQYESQKLEIQATLDLAIIDQRRTQNLRVEGAVSQDQLDQANTILAQAKARLAQVSASIRQAQASIQQAKDAIRQSESTVHQAQSGVTAANVNESYGTILAPFDGVVMEKLAYAGEIAAPGTPLLLIENPHHLQLEVSVPEENLRLIQVGQVVTVEVDAAQQSFEGTIAQIVPTADPNSRSFIVKIPLKSTSKQLISGMFGRISLSLGTQQQTLLVPTSALIRRGQLQGIYTVENQGEQPIAVLQWIKTGQTHNQEVEVVSGLSSGDRIITENPDQLSDGQPIAPQP